SHSINMEECVNGIRSCVFLPGEVATPILDRRPNPVGPEVRARMVQPQDCADLIRYICLLPARLVMNAVMLSPTHNRRYVAGIENLSSLETNGRRAGPAQSAHLTRPRGSRCNPLPTARRSWRRRRCRGPAGH